MSNLKYGDVIFGLNHLNSTSTGTIASTGSVLSLNGYHGFIELVNNTIANNLNFIPTAIFTNA